MDYNYKRWRIRQEGAVLEMRLKMQMVRARVPRLKQIPYILINSVGNRAHVLSWC